MYLKPSEPKRMKCEEVYVSATMNVNEKRKSKFLRMLGVKDYEEKAKSKSDESSSQKYKEM